MTKNVDPKLILTGVLVGAAALLLTAFGNPANMGFCIACFLRDTAGALGLHSAAAVQYARPEIIGIVFGALIVSIMSKEFAVKGGSAPVTKFILGMCVMVGALIFLGCPLRMVLRIAGGDLNAVVGLFGFAFGILVGVFFLNRGYSLKRTYSLPKTDGLVLPLISFGILLALLVAPGLLLFSEEGPGSMRAPILVSLIAGLAVGGAGFVTRICFAGGLRDSMLFKKFAPLSGLAAIIVVALVGNLVLGNFNLSFEGQPVAHTDGLWNFLGLALVGLGSVLLGGCPLRQLILAGSGNSDSVAAVFGLVAGAAVCHNFKLASSAAGVTTGGKIGFAIALAVMLVIAVMNSNVLGKAAKGSAQ